MLERFLAWRGRKDKIQVTALGPHVTSVGARWAVRGQQRESALLVNVSKVSQRRKCR